MSFPAMTSVQGAAAPHTARCSAYHRILVVVDPTRPGAQSAVDKAARIAAASGAVLEFYICDIEQDIPSSWAGPAGARQYREIRRQQHLRELYALAAPVQARGQSVEFACEWHAPLEEGIGHHVIRTQPDLVLTATARSEFAHQTQLTPTDWNLIRQIPASLLFVGAQPWRPQPRIAVAVDSCHTPAHTASVDDALVEEGRELAATLGGTLEIDRGLQSPAHRSEHRPDVLVVGAGALSRPVHSAAGGTAARMLERIDCDLLVVKPPAFVSPLLVTED